MADTENKNTKKCDNCDATIAKDEKKCPACKIDLERLEEMIAEADAVDKIRAKRKKKDDKPSEGEPKRRSLFGGLVK